MEQDRFYGTGKRKDAVARVWVARGTGEITINGQPYADYLHRVQLEQIVLQPLQLIEGVDKYDVRAFVKGGGICGQAGAVRHGIAKALVAEDEGRRTLLGAAGLLTRDPRVKERKHAGFRRARRAKQFSKR
ncbi:MAG: 30S ribosomal protein S9 [Armatimonadetes bacterium]|nr:30S ribosomal protein S9 [Armatimonadota bacterium]MDI9582700.1 30S ribosomal protein S9 [Acidobacteriota bacterium]